MKFVENARQNIVYYAIVRIVYLDKSPI